MSIIGGWGGRASEQVDSRSRVQIDGKELERIRHYIWRK
jgi:hypothetical protein